MRLRLAARPLHAHTPWGRPGRTGPARPPLTPPPCAERRTCSARRHDICSEAPLLPPELPSPDLCCLCIRLEHLQVSCRTPCAPPVHPLHPLHPLHPPHPYRWATTPSRSSRGWESTCSSRSPQVTLNPSPSPSPNSSPSPSPSPSPGPNPSPSPNQVAEGLLGGARNLGHSVAEG